MNSGREWRPSVEVFRTELLKRFSDKLSMEEIAECSYDLAETWDARASVSPSQAPAEAPAATEGPSPDEYANVAEEAASERFDRVESDLLRDRLKAAEEKLLELGWTRLNSGTYVATEGPGAQTVKELTLEIDREEDGRWIAEWTQSPGCLAYGNSEYDAIRKATDLLVPPAVPGAGSTAPPQNDEAWIRGILADKFWRYAFEDYWRRMGRALGTQGLPISQKMVAAHAWKWCQEVNAPDFCICPFTDGRPCKVHAGASSEGASQKETK